MDSKAASRLVGLFEAAERAISEKITRVLAQTDDKKKLTIRELEQQRKAVKKILRQLLSKTKKSSEAVVDYSGPLVKDQNICEIRRIMRPTSRLHWHMLSMA